VVLRFSDFKSNEYAHLLGGNQFEPVEQNPMLGWRGASRYYSLGYRDGFALECQAVARVRDRFGLRNLQVMIPFVRTVDELKLVLAELKQNGLEKGMCESGTLCCESNSSSQQDSTFSTPPVGSTFRTESQKRFPTTVASDVPEVGSPLRTDGSLVVLMMCEVPSNIILARDFLSLIDGFSIGSNDLAQLTLGVDRDSISPSYLSSYFHSHFF
jgi:pyruvate,water dikinase